MNDTAREIESGAIREIEPEIRTLFTKVVERDPREAAKMLEPYPDDLLTGLADSAPGPEACRVSELGHRS